MVPGQQQPEKEKSVAWDEWEGGRQRERQKKQRNLRRVGRAQRQWSYVPCAPGAPNIKAGPVESNLVTIKCFQGTWVYLCLCSMNSVNVAGGKSVQTRTLTLTRSTSDQLVSTWTNA